MAQHTTPEWPAVPVEPVEPVEPVKPTAIQEAHYRRRLMLRIERAIHAHLHADGAAAVERCNEALRLAAFLWGCEAGEAAVTLAIWHARRRGARQMGAVIRGVERTHCAESEAA